MSHPLPILKAPYSLQKRLVLVFGVLLILFLGLAGLVLERAFQESVEAALEERLQLQIYALLGVAEPEREGFFLPDLEESRFSQIDSGLYGFIIDGDGREVWRSPSALNLNLVESGFEPGQPGTGEMIYGNLTLEGQGPLLWASYGTYWQNQDEAFSFVVLQSTLPSLAEIRKFQSSLYLWFGAMGGLLSIAQILLLRWGLRPLQELAADVSAIESGDRDQLQGSYPDELAPVTQNLNLLIKGERERLSRYRSMLGDLAHSLKTPLAVLSAAVQEIQQGKQLSLSHQRDMEEQLARMDQIVSYQLKRAVSANQSHLLAKAIPVEPVLRKILAALTKVYRDKNVHVTLEVPDSTVFYGDESDFMELTGNLLDNAFKYGKGQVRVSAQQQDKLLELVVEDDGEGIPENQRLWVLQRGARADTVKTGQGIGLAVAVDVVNSYGGEIRIEHSSLGGACFRVKLVS